MKESNSPREKCQLYLLYINKEALQKLDLKEDRELCLKYLQESADANISLCAFELGVAYFEGKYPVNIVDKNKGIYYLKKALLGTYPQAIPYIRRMNIDLTKQ